MVGVDVLRSRYPRASETNARLRDVGGAQDGFEVREVRLDPQLVAIAGEGGTAESAP
jgi:hypothetical protein